jgi:hypothetical protein
MNALLQHAFEVVGIVRLQHAGFSRQVKVPQARGPKTQRTGTQHRVEQLAFGCIEGAHRLVSV